MAEVFEQWKRGAVFIAITALIGASALLPAVMIAGLIVVLSGWIGFKFGGDFDNLVLIISVVVSPPLIGAALPALRDLTNGSPDEGGDYE